MKKYIIALDAGTTSVRAIIYDKNLNSVGCAQKEFTQIYPKPGYVEHDAQEIFACAYSVMTEVLLISGIMPSEIAGIGITNQRETTVVWSRETGEPVCGAIVWQCRRTAYICREIEAAGHAPYIKETTGLPMDAYFSASKIKWILDNVPHARERAEAGELLFGTIDTWLIWRLTGGKAHVTDRTNASRTMLYDINKLCWDKKLMDIFGVPECMLPKVCSSGEVYGEFALMGENIPICAIAGDQQSALFGSCCFSAGEAKNTYGTGCFLLMNTGAERPRGESGLIATVAAGIAGEPVQYAAEGSVFVGGAVVKWLRDELGFIKSSADTLEIARSVTDSGGVYVVPAFTGMGAPYWSMDARGTIFGLTRGSGSAHIVRAALESIAYQSADVISAMEKDVGVKLGTLKVDGGASANDFLVQFQADISELTAVRTASCEATARGAAALAGLTLGFYKNREEIAALPTNMEFFAPKMAAEEREARLCGWHKAVDAALYWAEK
ncbi:MAG: glycerol kinase GlpK [Clostridia bacterium]|nr:glycerol kinase GlpK [Clostridia bacterium]